MHTLWVLAGLSAQGWSWGSSRRSRMQAVESIPAHSKECEHHSLEGCSCRPMGTIGRLTWGGGCFQKKCPGRGLAWMVPQVRAVVGAGGKQGLWGRCQNQGLRMKTSTMPLDWGCFHETSLDVCTQTLCSFCCCFLRGLIQLHILSGGLKVKIIK